MIDRHKTNLFQNITLFILIMMAVSIVNTDHAQASEKQTPSFKYEPSEAYKNSKYYEAALGTELTGNQGEDIIRIAMSQLGYHEGNHEDQLDGSNTSGNSNYSEAGYWFGTDVKGESGFYYDWCAMFVSWCARLCEIPENIISNATYASAEDELYSFENTEFYQSGTYLPSRGDLIFFDWDGEGDSSDHVGIVVSANDSYVVTVEGNAGEKVRNRVVASDDKIILGYGKPGYSNSADETENPKKYVVYGSLLPVRSQIPKGEYEIWKVKGDSQKEGIVLREDSGENSEPIGTIASGQKIKVSTIVQTESEIKGYIKGNQELADGWIDLSQCEATGERGSYEGKPLISTEEKGETENENEEIERICAAAFTGISNGGIDNRTGDGNLSNYGNIDFVAVMLITAVIIMIVMLLLVEKTPKTKIKHP